MKKLVYFIFLLLPFIDLASSITTRFTNISMSIGAILKGLLLIFLVIYTLFFTKSKYKKISVIYIILTIIFSLAYLLTKPIFWNFEIIFNELNYLVKFLFFPISFFAFLCIFDDINFDKKKVEKLMLYTIITYSILLILPILTKTSFNTYENGLYGMVGWFYAANEISTILVLLFPFSYLLINNKRKYLFLGILPILLVISYVGTKVSLFGLIISGFIVLIISYLYNKKIFKNPFISSFIIFVVILIINFGSYTIKNFFTVLDTPSQTEIYECIECEELPGDSLLTKIKKYGLRLLSQRNYFLKNTNDIYRENFSNETFLLGLGFNNNNEINNPNVTKLIEMDILDIFYHLGFLAVLLFLFPFIFLLYLFTKVKFKLTKERVFYSLMILMSLGISTIAGHVYMAPAVSIYVVIYCMFLANELNAFQKPIINKNKLAILALHMGYGGVENAIATQASMLSNEYDVEIISLYKQEYQIPFKLDSKVKVTYLLNTVSNRQEFIDNLKHFHLIKTLKEGFKSIYILLNKNNKIIKYLINSDAKIIISTRYEFSKLLNKYGREDIVKISEQHVYDISDKYVAKLNKLKNIDYLMPVSKNLLDNYQNRVNTKLYYIPLSLNYYPKENELSHVDNKNLIAIGRLDKIKGFADLITIMDNLVNEDPEIKLNIFGDGPEKEKLKELINKKGLEKNIKLWGFKKQTFIKDYLKNSSLYLMSSFEESFGLVVIEAMSYGVPCIAFDSAKGVLDVINEENGYLIPNRDINLYTKTILNYFKLSSEEKKRLSTSARLTSTKYSFDNVQKEWLKFINSI